MNNRRRELRNPRPDVEAFRASSWSNAGKEPAEPASQDF
jgi:hypothetical protein